MMNGLNNLSFVSHCAFVDRSVSLCLYGDICPIWLEYLGLRLCVSTVRMKISVLVICVTRFRRSNVALRCWACIWLSQSLNLLSWSFFDRVVFDFFFLF
jgi:hypothetical protein